VQLRPILEAQAKHGLCRLYDPQHDFSYIRHHHAKVFAQDPEYSSNEEAYLAEHFDMNVVPDPEGFEALTENTFISTILPDVPVRQIVPDMTHEYSGPTGFFCQEIGSDGLECDGRGRRYGDDRNICPYTACPSAPALLDYKQKAT
jgi:hypothetical protein